MQPRKKSKKKKVVVFLVVAVVLIGGWFFLKPDQNQQNSSANKSFQQTASLIQQIRSIDSDKDGLTDREEDIFKTDPHNPDTDNDGYLDGQEISAGYNPLIPSPGDKITDLKTYLDQLKPEIDINLPDESELKISLETGKEPLEKYFQQAQTPASLKDSEFYSQAFLEARTGQTKKLDQIIYELNKSYQHLQNITVPIEALQIHRLTLATIPPLIYLFEDLKTANNDPIKVIALIKSSEYLTPYILAIQKQIQELTDKYNLEIPE